MFGIPNIRGYAPQGRKSMSLTESMEDYLEAIYEIEQSKKVVRVRDVARKLGVTMPSVNGALKNLEAKGLINHEKYEYIELTKAGASCAAQISENHQLIATFLHDILGVDVATAEQDACKLEHDLSVKTLDKLTDYIRANDSSRVKECHPGRPSNGGKSGD